MNKLYSWNDIKRDARPRVRYWIPCAAVRDEDLIEELKQLKERGFGGVEIVTLGTTPKEIQLSEDGWGTANWDHVIEVIAATTQELGMAMDLANGPAWPISVPTVASADDPAAICELTYGVIRVGAEGIYHGPLPERRTIHEEGTPVLVHVMAYRRADVGEQEEEEASDLPAFARSLTGGPKPRTMLLQDSYRDLTDCLMSENGENWLDCQLTGEGEGDWLIFAFYRQPSVHKTGVNQFYVVDHLSKAGVEACRKYWHPILEKNGSFPSLESFFCDSLEYRVCMDWTPDFPAEFEARRGYSILPYLPFIGVDALYPNPDVPGYCLEEAKLSEMINMDYTETLTQLYDEYHLAGLEEMASAYGKSIRYQVAYNKPFEGERSPLFVQIPENEALGRPAIDFQRTMASAVHLGRKKRYSFECGAEFGNSYGQDHEDLLWWIKRSYMAGMNAQVLHGASYSGHYDGRLSVNQQLPGVNWPGYEGFGKFVSNNWNRTLSVEDQRACLDAVARMNSIFLKKAKVDCAIYRQSYLNSGMGSEFCFYEDGGALTNAGYTYETISPYLLDLPVCRVEDGVLDPEGVGYKTLIVPEQERLSVSFLKRACELLDQGFPIIWIGNPAKDCFYFAEYREEKIRKEWKLYLEIAWGHRNSHHVASVDHVVEMLHQIRVCPAAELDGTRDIMTARREDEEAGVTYYALYGYNRIVCSPEDPNTDESACSAMYKKGTTKGSYARPGRGSRKAVPVNLEGSGTVYAGNPWTGEWSRLDFVEKDGRLQGEVYLEEDELLLLAVVSEEETLPGQKSISSMEPVAEIPVEFNTLTLYPFGPDTSEETSFLRSSFAEAGDKMDLTGLQLAPWTDLCENWKKIAGCGRYEGRFQAEVLDAEKRYVLQLGEVCDTFRVWVNGKEAAFPDQVLKNVEITELLITGENRIEVQVFSNLYNKIVDGGPPAPGERRPPVKYLERKYGIWESENKKISVLVIE